MGVTISSTSSLALAPFFLPRPDVAGGEGGGRATSGSGESSASTFTGPSGMISYTHEGQKGRPD
jgi:hypothetical protein